MEDRKNKCVHEYTIQQYIFVNKKDYPHYFPQTQCLSVKNHPSSLVNSITQLPKNSSQKTNIIQCTNFKQES